VIFAVDEPAKTRRRLILWPRAANDVLRPQFDSTVGDCIAACAFPPAVHAHVVDMPAGFYQVPLAPAVRPFFAFRLGGAMWQPTKLPMGVSFAPDLLEALLDVLLAAAAADAPGDVAVHRHVDNIRFLSVDAAATTRRAAAFDELVRSVGGQVDVVADNDFLGAAPNYSTGTVQVTQRILAKIREGAAAVLDAPQCRMGDFRAFLSRCVFASRVLRLPLAEFFGVFKCARRRFAAFNDNSDIITVWPTAITEWRRWVATIGSNTPVAHPLRPTRPTVTLSTDASITGYGAVLVDEAGGVRSLGAQWPEAHTSSEINELEARAVAAAARALVPQNAKAIHLVVDNTSVSYALKKGSAAAYLLNCAVRDALVELPRDCDIQVSYIASEKNPADSLSRGGELAPEALRPACGEVAEDWTAGRTLRVRTAGRFVHHAERNEARRV
jgi:hypothetical protein